MLAPAGDRECLEAAVRAGADAVYFGLGRFNARARATNFSVEALPEAVEHLHAHGVRAHVTLNTLVFDDELGEVQRAIEACARAGVDALIVQDLGVMALARAIAPSLPLHASTQMTCTDVGSVELARSLGASRVVLARELSLADIEAIRRGTDVELEVFVHGALCIAYSGQCLTSEAIGGRSANRGACAQACRLPYELVVDGALRDLGDRAHLLSPEDLEASRLVPELMRLGIASFKIEGRLKGPEYVAASTRLYRAAIDAALEREVRGGRDAELDEARGDALAMYSRGSGPGFMEGVDHQRLVEGRGCDHRGLFAGTAEAIARRGERDVVVVSGAAPEARETGSARPSTRPLSAGSVESLARGDGVLFEGGRAGEGEVGGRLWDVRAVGEGSLEIWLGPDVAVRGVAGGTRVWKTDDPARAKRIRHRIERAPHRVAIEIEARGKAGEALVIAAASERGHRAEVRSEMALVCAERHPLDAARLREQLGRLGESPFVLGGLRVELEGEVMLPISELNRMRRELVGALARSIRHEHALAPAGRGDPPALPPPPRGGLFVLCRTHDQALAASEAADGVILDFLELTGTGTAVRTLRERRSGVPITLAPPRVRKPGEEKIDRFLRSLRPDAMLVRGLGALVDSNQDLERIGDFSLNASNRASARIVLAHGLSAFTPAFDLDSRQLLAMLDGELARYAEVVLHHPMPLFYMEHCVIAALLSNGGDHRSCGRPCEKHQISLRDRAGMDHPVEADVGCRNTVFHARAQSAADLVPALRGLGVGRWRIELVRESADQVRALVAAYRALIEGRSEPREALRAIKTEAGYGVVKGSLRVL